MSDTRRSFLTAHARGDLPVEALLEAFDIKKSAAYALLKRAREVGVDDAVEVRSRAAKHHPNALGDEVHQRVLQLRATHSWGPKKLRKLYIDAHGDTGAPSTSSIGNILKAHGHVRPYRPRRRRTEGPPLTPGAAPNDVWAVDHKGPMRELDDIEPLNAIDLHSRYWIGCAPFVSKRYETTRAVFEEWFDQYGLPKVIRVDAGVPWVTVGAPLGLTRLSAWWLTLGVRFEVAPRCQLNGCIERLHGTMERDMNVAGVVDVREHFDTHRRVYNQVRPHEALGQEVPASLYVSPNTRRRAVEHVYDPVDDGCDEKRSVTGGGVISWQGKPVFVTEALEGRVVGLRQLRAATWSVRFHGLHLGLLDDKGFHREQVLGTNCPDA